MSPTCAEARVVRIRTYPDVILLAFAVQLYFKERQSFLAVTGSVPCLYSSIRQAEAISHRKPSLMSFQCGDKSFGVRIVALKTLATTDFKTGNDNRSEDSMPFGVWWL